MSWYGLVVDLFICLVQVKQKSNEKFKPTKLTIVYIIDINNKKNELIHKVIRYLVCWFIARLTCHHDVNQSSRIYRCSKIIWHNTLLVIQYIDILIFAKIIIMCYITCIISVVISIFTCRAIKILIKHQAITFLNMRRWEMFWKLIIVISMNGNVVLYFFYFSC
jgi:hypothetical protein